MADNVTLNPGSNGSVIAADEISGAYYQRVKLIHGVNGTNDGDVATGNPLPTDLYVGGTASSANNLLAVADFKFLVASGAITGVSWLRKFGLNEDVDGDEDIIEFGGSMPWPSSAEALEIISSSDNDKPGESGARTVAIYGLDSSWDEQSETVTLNGSTGAVDLANTYIRVNRIYVMTAGSGGVNAGTLTLRVDGGGATRAVVIVGQGQTQMAVWTVPAGKTLYMTSYYAGVTRASPAATTLGMQLYVRADASAADAAWNLKHETGITTDANVDIRVPMEYFPITEKSDIRLTAKDITKNDGIVFGGFDGIVT